MLRGSGIAIFAPENDARLIEFDVNAVTGAIVGSLAYDLDTI